ncbi:MAG: antitoxin [Micrococcales bacterium]|nr:antitoxin [Micrococcales bacterium]
MVDVSGMFAKAKRLLKDNPDAVRGGLDKVESLVNDKTGSKFQDKLTKGRDGLDKALGVPAEAKDAYREEHQQPQAPDPVRVDPIDKPESIGTPNPFDELRSPPDGR